MIGGAKPTLLAGRDAIMSLSIPACVEGDESGSDVQAASSGRPTNTSRAVAALILVMRKASNSWRGGKSHVTVGCRQ